MRTPLRGAALDAAMADLLASVKAQNTPEARAKRLDAQRLRKYDRQIRYAHQCHLADAQVVSAKLGTSVRAFADGKIMGDDLSHDFDTNSPYSAGAKEAAI